MSREENKSIIEVADMHEFRLQQALKVVNNLFPLNGKIIENLTEAQLFAMETLVSRYSKLQDLMGAKLFDLCLLKIGENIDGLSMIDKANKLEKASILEKNIWMELRKLRNNVTYEYPHQPEITANILNALYNQLPQMLQYYLKLKSIIEEG